MDKYLMDTRQGDLFDGDPDARECASCGRSFVPDWDSDKYCDECFERKQRQQPGDEEGGAEWVEGFYGQTG
ncbi:hypothetical protein [Salinibacter altiplanensis]|uniref:hypothetical protein n=1 Tax=Salinibacter altiplanensis TaxID=1803181 RepID=UPI000C9FCC1C|nr:hypothetical protein [Salinibacter altiplanensis]